jgi:hypothetical protein
MRNIIFRGRGRVSEASDQLVREMLQRWDSTPSTVLTQYSEVDVSTHPFLLYFWS